MTIIMLFMTMIVMMVMLSHRMKNANESSDLVLNYLQISTKSRKLFHFSNFPIYCREQNCLLVRAETHICFKVVQCQYSQKWNVKCHTTKIIWQYSLLSNRHLLNFSCRKYSLIASIHGLLLLSVLMHCNSLQFVRRLLVKRRLDTLD
jgi:hypothetical protein